MMRGSFWLTRRFGACQSLLGSPSLRPQSIPHRPSPSLIPGTSFSSSTDTLVSRFCQKFTDLKDYALPNASWSPEMMRLYKEFLEKTKDGEWIKLPSFKSNSDHIRGLKLPSGFITASDKEDYRIFTRCIEKEGQGYEYVIFFHPSKKKSICLFQPGPYLEGAPGYAHGGSLTALVDETFSKTAYLSGHGLFTLNLNIKFKNPIPVGSVALLKVEVEKIEDQKIFLSCIALSPDEQVLFAKASGVFLQLELEEQE
ncbi:acyl-coenzyme A thioesterase THEM5 isoform X2 [Antechinus flavipes]|uniref:acyl-coenzyme A thioesterase THEM5 isoform X1 n=1 Tax=Antechinus flavipes TaxID=38775 RepID=UPI002236B91E|nr:acyl-coenzyme A thioesterase THEM5 isoform X1 [Antechinus flavipes]XP_051848561.1 acyl-coenzyme A thioesterase THEM5 isoform X2 [Antechinus flavipes]